MSNVIYFNNHQKIYTYRGINQYGSPGQTISTNTDVDLTFDQVILEQCPTILINNDTEFVINEKGMYNITAMIYMNSSTPASVGVDLDLSLVLTRNNIDIVLSKFEGFNSHPFGTELVKAKTLNICMYLDKSDIIKIVVHRNMSINLIILDSSIFMINRVY